jgi:hypothetical protein
MAPLIAVVIPVSFEAVRTAAITGLSAYICVFFVIRHLNFCLARQTLTQRPVIFNIASGRRAPSSFRPDEP